jgi:hypothetical protein
MPPDPLVWVQCRERDFPPSTKNPVLIPDVVCYKWLYNFKGVTVTVGALLNLFQFTIKATTSIFISLNAYLTSTHE